MSETLQDIVTNHWDLRAPSYLNNIKKDFLKPEIRCRWEKVLTNFITPTENLAVLDAGCGPAPITNILIDLGHRVTAVDISKQMLANAKAAVGHNYNKVSFIACDVSNIPISDNTFDIVISRHLVWTLPEPQRAVREWYRILKPGGRLGIIDGNWYLSHSKVNPRKYWVYLNHLFHKIRSGFDGSQKLASHYIEKLPTTYLSRPDWDLGLLAGTGFHNLKASTDLDNRIWEKPLQKFFHNPLQGMFMVEGTKP